MYIKNKNKKKSRQVQFASVGREQVEKKKNLTVRHESKMMQTGFGNIKQCSERSIT